MTTMFVIPVYRHDPARRKHRFRCNKCSKLIPDGVRVVGEKRGTSSHAYHGDCWEEGGLSVEAAKARMGVAS